MAGATPNRLSEYLPLLAFIAAWALQLVYFLGYDARTFFTFGFSIVSVILLAVGAYVAGFFACRLLPIAPTSAVTLPLSTIADVRASTILTQVTLVMAAFLIMRNIVLPFAQGVSLSGAREIALESWENGDLLARVSAVLANVTIAFSLMTIIDRIDIKGRFPIILVLIFIVLTIAAYSRAHLLMGLSIISIKWISQSKYRLSYIFLVFMLFTGLFSILSIVASVGSADRAGGVEDVLKSLEVYTFGGVAGFEFFYTTGLPQYQSMLTVPRFIYSIFPGLGLPPPSYFPFIDTVPPINVFSALFPPYHDFGKPGLVIFFLAYGFISALVALAFQRRPNRYLCVLSGFLLYAALMSPFDDQFIRGLTILILMMSGTTLFGILHRAIRTGLRS